MTNFVGNGIIFPIEINKSGAPVISTGFKLVNSSIKIILGWPLGSRIFLSGFGSILDSLLEEPNDDLLRGLAEYFIFESLTLWEKRIEVTDVVVTREEPQKLFAQISYRLKGTDLEETMVYPFYNNINT